MMAKPRSKSIFTCQNCGAQRPRWEGRCSDCGAWNSFVEEKQQVSQGPRSWSVSGGAGGIGNSQVVRLDEGPVHESQQARMTTGIEEFDRVLGGGLVPGSFVLLGGSPGIGKSTLLLQMTSGVASAEKEVLYVSGEESVAQSVSRAHRLGVQSSRIQMACESRLEDILEMAKDKRPEVLIVDSIQTVYSADLQAAPGSVSQVRESAGRLMSLAKGDGITVILIGHVTKDGNLAGPKVLEHMVDTVLSFDGDGSHNYRLLRALKNRFGPASELAVFEMSGIGLKEVPNPSELFLAERGSSLIGSAVFPALEGSRPLLCEVQALTAPSQMSTPRRTAIGVETNRVHLLIAVLDRHLDTKFYQHEVYVNVVGGLRIEETAADLAVAAALLSAEGRQELNLECCYFGEIGLTGEIRAVPQVELRVREALKLGFTQFVLPASNKKHLAELMKDPKVKAEWIWLKDVRGLRRTLGVKSPSSPAKAKDSAASKPTAPLRRRAPIPKPKPNRKVDSEPDDELSF